MEDNLLETTLFKDDGEKEAIINDPNLVRTLFWINNLGFLALKKEYPKHYLIIKALKNLKSARIANISDDDNDMAVSLKMAFDKGYLRLSFVNEYTKLLFLLKTKPSLDINEDILRALFNKVVWATMLPDPRIRPVIKDWLDGKIKLAELIKPFYQYAKLHKHSDAFQLIARMTGAFSADFSDDDAATDALIDKKPDPVPVTATPVAQPAQIPVDKGIPIPATNVAVTPTPTPVVQAPAPVSAPVVQDDKKDEPEPTAKAIVNTPTVDEAPKANITTVTQTAPIVAQPSETIKVDAAGEVVVKKRGRPKKTAADVTVTNKVAIVNYDDDRYKQIVEDASFVVSVANDKFLDPNSYSNDADRFNVYVLLASVYAKDLDKYYTSIYGDKRTAKKNIIRTYRDVASFIHTYGRINYDIDLDAKVGFGEIKISPVGINMSQNTYERLYQHKLYSKPQQSDKLSEKMSEERFDELLENGITPTVKEVFDALSSTAEYMFTEGEYKKAVDTYLAGMASGVVWFSPYEYNRLGDLSKFSKSYARYTNYHRLIDMYCRSYDNYQLDKAVHVIELVYNHYADILVSQAGILKEFNTNLMQIFNKVEEIHQQDFVDFFDIMEKMNQDTAFVDALSNLVKDTYNLNTEKLFKKYPVDSEIGKRFLALASSGFFAKMKISVNLADVKVGGAALITLVTRVGEFIGFATKTKSSDYMTTGDYIERINEIIGTPEGFEIDELVDDKSLKKFVIDNGGTWERFIEDAIDFALNLSTHKRFSNFNMISELPYVLVEPVVAKAIEMQQFDILAVGYGASVTSQQIVKRYLDEHRQELTQMIKTTPFSSVDYWNKMMTLLRYTYNDSVPIYGYWDEMLTGTNVVSFFGTTKISSAWSDFTLVNMMSLNDATTNSFIQMLHSGDISFSDVNIILYEKIIHALDLLIKAQRSSDYDRFFKIFTELLATTMIDQTKLKSLFDKILSLNDKPHEIQIRIAKMMTDVSDTVPTDVKKIMNALSAMVIDHNFAGNEDISLDILSVNPELTLKILSRNIAPLFQTAGMFGPSYSNNRITQIGSQNFFSMYSKLGQMINISKKWDEYIAHISIMNLMRSLLSYGGGSFDPTAFVNAGIDNYKSVLSVAHVQSAIGSYVEYIVTSRRKNSKDLVSETLIRYNRNWYKVYANIIREKMKESNVKITPTVAKNMGFGTLFNDIYNDSDLSEQDRKEQFDEYLKLVFGDEKITPKHIESITDDMVTNKAVMDMLSNTKSVLPIYLRLTPKGLSDILKFNDFDVKTHADVKFSAAEFKNKGVFNSIKDAIEKVDIVGVPDLQVTKLDLSTDDLDAISYDLYEKKYNGRHGDIACVVLDVYDVHIRPDELVQFKNNHPNAKVETQLFHGTGSVAANMILRFGFKVVTQAIGGVQVTGKMLGNGIYLSPVLEKSLQYVGDSGFGRRFGTIGYVFESNLYISDERTQVRRAGYGGDNIRSPELVVYDGRSQIEIYKCYKVKLVSKSVLKDKRINRSI
ncbi:poly [ADP-ribose] polymerase 1 domain-like protein [Ochrobactrum phage vB_OspM_OC]|nr:poly [ADP-ribose] polymerase 1 domain-like protein [Ochrobactrum phage vB_OspM_OC]